MTFHPAVRIDLHSIYDFIASDSVENANRFIAALIDACADLERTPGIGHSRSDLARRPVRFWSLRNYTIAYYEQSVGSIRVLAITEGSRDLKRLVQTRFESESGT